MLGARTATTPTQGFPFMPRLTRPFWDIGIGDAMVVVPIVMEETSMARKEVASLIA